MSAGTRSRRGRATKFRQHYLSSISATLESKSNTAAQLAYLDEGTTEVVIVRLFADADGLDVQLQGAGDRSKVVYDLIEPASIEIFGTPNPNTVETMKRIAGSGVAVKVYPSWLGGFMRSLSGRVWQ